MILRILIFSTAPVGNRKITIVASGNAAIDGNTTRVLQEPYEVLRVFFRDGQWFIV